MNEKPHDYDIYFKDKETVLAVATYYCDKFNKANNENAGILIQDSEDEITKYRCPAGRVSIFIKSKGVAGESPDDESEIFMQSREQYVNLIEQVDSVPEKTLDELPPIEKYRPVYLSDNAITLSNRVQLVIRFYGTPEDIHKNYDFVHVTNYWESSNDNLVLKPEALESILTKELRYMGSLYPLASIIRSRKFLKRGWNINAGQYLKMCFQVSELNLHDINVLAEQLVGVDQTYFRILVNALVEQKEKNPDFTFDTAYVVSIIDKIF
jgi:hypothetical protein